MTLRETNFDRIIRVLATMNYSKRDQLVIITSRNNLRLLAS
jgi:hypothetical protein